MKRLILTTTLLCSLLFLLSPLDALTMAEQYYFKGKSARLSNDWPEAQENLLKAIKAGVNDALIDHYYVHQALDQEENAIHCLTEASKDWSLKYEAQLLLANHFAIQENYQKALQVLQKILPDYPKDRTVLSRLLELLILQERYAEALPIARKISDIYPKEAEFLENVLFLEQKNEKYTMALKTVTKLRIFDKTNPGYQLIEGALLFNVGKVKEAHNLLNNLAKQHPEITETFFQLGVINEYLGQEKTAREYYQEYLKTLNDEERKKAVLDIVKIRQGQIQSTRIKSK
jgi:tetratricopeptide (TPR) repeat protein